jgi:putative ABC transport system ATP-binding protein
LLDSLLNAQHLSRYIGDKPLLDDVSLAIAPGQRIGLVGNSGSGKSTLLRVIAMLDPLDAGMIRYAGTVIRGAAVPAHRRKVAYLNQRPAMIAGSVEDNLRLPFELASCNQTFDRSEAIGMLTELGRSPTLIDQNAGKLSGGEQQSVALVRSMLAGPEILLLDEPTASLDSASTEAVERFLLNWANSDDQRAWIWASHDVDQVARMNDRILRVQTGKLADA